MDANLFLHGHFEPISGWVDETSVTETVDSVSIAGHVKPLKQVTMKIRIYSFPRDQQ